MFLACSSPKEPATPVILDSSYSQTIIDDRYVNDLCMYFYYVNYIAYKRSIFLLKLYLQHTTQMAFFKNSSRMKFTATIIAALTLLFEVYHVIVFLNTSAGLSAQYLY